jgi:hypothetical protein
VNLVYGLRYFSVSYLQAASPIGSIGRWAAIAISNYQLRVIFCQNNCLAGAVSLAFLVHGLKGEIITNKNWKLIMISLCHLLLAVLHNQSTGMFNGYLCFVISIAYIGICTAVIGDVAAQLGCFIYLKDCVNAIAFVALGTSVPGINP